jgi:uncharacterized protein
MENKKNSETRHDTQSGKKITKAVLLIGGLICVGLGALGLVLPILPTTPFLLLAAACFCRSSTRMYDWLLNNRWFGDYIKNYRKGLGIPIKTKIIALTILWVTISVSTLFLLNRILTYQLLLPLQLIMIGVAVGVSMHILRLPTFRRKNLNKEAKF